MDISLEEQCRYVAGWLNAAPTIKGEAYVWEDVWDIARGAPLHITMLYETAFSQINSLERINSLDGKDYTYIPESPMVPR